MGVSFGAVLRYGIVSLRLSHPSNPRRRCAIATLIAVVFSAFVCGCCAAPAPAPPPSERLAGLTPSSGADSAFGFLCGGVRYWSDGATGRTWQQARAFCQSLGGDLASIHSEAERVCANRALAASGATPLGAWIGLAEQQQEGAWQWSDGTTTDFTAWSPGEPNNDSRGPNDCAHLWRDRAFGWNDIPCERTDASVLCRLP